MNSHKKSVKIRNAAGRVIIIPKPLSLILDLNEKKFFSLLSWAVTAFGGIIVMFHFLYTRYFPALDFTSAVGLLVIIAITGSTIILYLSSALTAPLLIWSMFLETDNKDEIGVRKHPLKTVFLFTCPVFAFFLALIGTAWYSVTGGSNNAASWLLILSFGSSVLLGAALCSILHRWLDYPRISGRYFINYLTTLFFSLISYTFTPVVAFLFYFSRYSTGNLRTKGEAQGMLLIIIASIICLFFNSVIFGRLVRNENTKRGWFFEQLGFGLLLLGIILFVNQSWFSIPQGVLRMYGLADVENVRIVFDEKGCSIIKQVGINYISDDKNMNCFINHATVLSDIGSDRFIASEEGKEFTVSKNLATVVRIPALPLASTVTRFVDANGKLRHIKVELESKRQETGLFVGVIVVDRSGKLLARDTIGRNVTVGSSEGFNCDYMLPEGLSALDDIWCDLEIKKDGKELSIQSKKSVIYD